MKETLKAFGRCRLSHFNLSNGQSTASKFISAAGSAYRSTASSISKSVEAQCTGREKVDLKDFAVEGLHPLRLGMELLHCLGRSVEFVTAGADRSASTCST